MPNYRLTHKITGTLSPDFSGYYGLDGGSSTILKRAGGGAYLRLESGLYILSSVREASGFVAAQSTASLSEPYKIPYYGVVNDKPCWSGTDTEKPDWGAEPAGIKKTVLFDGEAWRVNLNDEPWLINQTTGDLPGETGWLYADTLEDASQTMPALIIASTGDEARFEAMSLSGPWTTINGATGTPVYSEYTLSESWDSAEKAVFDSLSAWLGNTDEVDCFRGYIPINEDGKPKFVNVWKISSGSSAGGFDISRTYGEAGAWCNMLIDAKLEGIFENRSTAMHFAGAVELWLRETGNLHQTGIIDWCRLRDLPVDPKETIIMNHRYWTVKIPLEILYLTEGVFE